MTGDLTFEGFWLPFGEKLSILFLIESVEKSVKNQSQ